jgi:hypothetical protein
MPPERPVSGVAAPFRPVLADDVDAADRPPARRGPIRRAARLLFGTIFGGLGIATLILGLAVVATIPVLQFVSLGYLLEVSGRIGRTGRLRSGFIGLRPAGVAGVFLAVLGIIWLILRYFGSMAVNAQIIAPGSEAARTWGFFAVLGVGILSAAALGLFLIVQFFRPSTYADLRDGLWHTITRRLPYYFWLGLRGFVGGMIWLAAPVTLLVAASLLPDAASPRMQVLGAMLKLAGALGLMVVVVHLPFLQTQMAAENRFAAMFRCGSVYGQFWRAPIVFSLAVTVTLLSALPLYLLKIEKFELVYADAAWLPSLAFVMFIFTARMLTGWAYVRGRREESSNRRRRFLLRAVLCSLCAMLMSAVAAFYALIVFFKQYAVWQGVWGMYEQHAFLLPVPFLGG